MIFRAVILFVVEDILYNIYDRAIEFEIFKMNKRVQVIRRTLIELSLEARLGSNKELYV